MTKQRTRSAAALLCTLALGVAGSVGVTAASAAPKGEFAAFADCPLANAELSGCIVAKATSGEIKIGNQAVPITNPITLQGGFIEHEGGLSFKFLNAADGKTLSKSPQNVPGGLLGLNKCSEAKTWAERARCEELVREGLYAVKATVELAGPVGLSEAALLFEFGTALSLPVKVKLENPLLGNACYIGSNAAPITVNLTSGTTSPPLPNKPIRGEAGGLSTRAEGGILVLGPNRLVENAFAVPGASGCGCPPSSALDKQIDARLGIPAAAGRNTAILNGTQEQTSAEEARRH